VSPPLLAELEKQWATEKPEITGNDRHYAYAPSEEDSAQMTAKKYPTM